MKKIVLWIAVGVMGCIGCVVDPQNQAEMEKHEGWPEKCDTNGNGKITCAEARACGLKTPIMKDHPAYAYMNDRDGDGQVCE